MNTGTDTDFDIAAFVRRYVAVWNEPDPARRRAEITALWAEDGVEYLDSAEFRGHRALEERVTQAHEELVERGGFVFRPAGDASAHHGAVHFTTHMVPAGGGAVAWNGVVLVLLDDDGRILRDYQFTGPPADGKPADGEPAGTRAVVDEYLRRCGQGDPERIAELYAPAVDWQVSWPVDDHPAVPWIRPRATRADVADHHRSFGALCVPAEGRVSVDHLMVDGDDAVLIGSSSQQVVSTGRRFSMRFALRLSVEGGLITRHHMYEDSLAVVEAFEGA
ncbi:nuclear transport factor 2 family protein [Streptomyces sp. NPDC021100]|uniref:nuclear transport factor 2 family protein n=1 Tax=Streptomyces sp. NPDC021100 TaxID=3365114 RepID=UPI0037B7B3D1